MIFINHPVLPLRSAWWLALLLLATSRSTLTVATKILDSVHTDSETGGGTRESEDVLKPGDGPGRPLYALNTIELPSNLSAGTACITLRFDVHTHSLTVDTHGKDANFVAHACFNDAIERTGWSTLTVSTTDLPAVPLAVRAYGAGLLEGLLTHDLLQSFQANVKLLLAKDLAGDEALRLTVEKQIRFALLAWESLAGGDAAFAPDGDIPKQAWAALLQMRGIRDGHNLVASAQGTSYLSAYWLLAMNMHAELAALSGLHARSETTKLLKKELERAGLLAGMQVPTLAMSLLQRERSREQRRWQATEIEDLVPSSAIEGLREVIDGRRASNEQSNRDPDPEAQRRLWALWTAHQARGTALVRRVGPKGSPDDLLVGQVAFANYGEMVRIMKHYHFNLDSLVTDISMSSYPGCISSTDDFSITNKGLALLSTSLYIPPEGGGNHSVPSTDAEGLPAFLRAAVATRLAVLPRTWAKVYGTLPGLAASKQWLLIDYSKLKEQQPLGNDTVWLVESLPRLQRFGDVTEHLRSDGYFAIQGQPHFRQIREIFGFSPFAPSTYELHHESSLADKATTVNNLGSARQVLSEILSSRGEKQASISARYDIFSENPIPAGGIDAKVTSKCMVQNLGFQGRSGPPATQGIAPFTWLSETEEELWAGWPHEGMPDTFDFEWASLMGDGVIGYPLDPGKAACEPASANDPEAALSASG